MAISHLIIQIRVFKNHKVALCEFLSDVGLTGEEPIHGLVQVVLGGLGDVQFLGQSGGILVH